MSKLDGLDINLLYNNLIRTLNEMHKTESDTGVSFLSLPNNNVLTINLEIKKPQQLQIPGLIPIKNWRIANLHPDYEYKSCPEYGIGQYPVSKITGEVCDCKMVWNENETRLSCPVCGLDGT